MTEFALISLVSGQPMPNVMAVLQDDRYFTHLEFIVSADKNKHDQYDKEFDEAYERIKEFLEQRGRTATRQPPVDPYDIKATLNACQEAVNIHHKMGHKVVFNITGGTKVMSLAAYLCAQHNQLEAIYIESRDRFLISIPPTGDFVNAVATGSLESKRKRFNESRFREIDVPSYVALHGREIDQSIQVDDLGKDQIDKAIIIAQQYSKLRSCLSSLQDEIKKAYKAKTITWPFQIEFKKPTRIERDALECFATNGILSWDTSQRIISCDKEQRTFLDGKWIEIYTLYSLAASHLFHDVRGNVTIKNWDGECDIMLTANAKLAIIECKSNAILSQQFGKIRAIQQDRGGLYGQSFFVRSGPTAKIVDQQAKFYKIDLVINVEDITSLVEKIAQRMGIDNKRDITT